MMTTRSLSGVGILVVFAALLTGCAGEPPASQPTPSETTEQPEVTVTPTPAPADSQDASIPTTCNELIPPETVQSYDSRLTLIAEGQPVNTTLSELLGPATVTALKGGTSQVYCGWGIEQTGAFAYLGVAAIGEQEQVDLLAAFQGSVYEEVDPGGAVARFVQGVSYEHQYIDDIVIGDDLLVAVSHSIEGNFAPDAFGRITQTTRALEQ